MNIQEFYSAIQEDYQLLTKRLPSPRLIDKFVRKFPAAISVEALQQAYQSSDKTEAAEIAHTLKGVALNLEFTKLASLADELCVMLRTDPDNPQAENLLNDTIQMYRQICSTIQQLS